MDQGVVLLVRSPLDPAKAATTAETAIHSVDKDLPVRIAPMTQTVAESLAKRRFLTMLLAAFGVLALILAGVGVYGVMAYQVAQKKHEIGVRKALGARASDVAELFIGRGIMLALSGVALGVAGALALSRLTESVLFGVKPWDALTLILAPLVLAALGVLASYLPARPAARVDPMTALRQE